MSQARTEVLQQENARLDAMVADLSQKLAAIKQQPAWFKRRLFHLTWDRRLDLDRADRPSLFEALGIELPPVRNVSTAEVHYRRREKHRNWAVNESGLRFDETVPVVANIGAAPA